MQWSTTKHVILLFGMIAAFASMGSTNVKNTESRKYETPKEILRSLDRVTKDLEIIKDRIKTPSKNQKQKRVNNAKN